MRLSIITVCLNSASTIEETIQSVISQSYSNIEYIIVDGGSTDGTLSIINKYRDRISRVISQKDDGIYDAMNKGIDAATGDVVGIINSDDIYADNQVLARVARVMTESQTDICWGDLVYVRRDDPSHVTRTWQSSPYVPGHFQNGWGPPHPSFFVRRNVYLKYGKFNAELKVSADYEIMLRFLEKIRLPGVYIPATMVKMRDGGNSNWRNLARVLAGNKDVARAWELNGLRRPIRTILFKLARKIRQIF